MKTGFKKIGVLRANALGDFILSLPALEALKSSYPDAEVVLLGRTSHLEFLKNKKAPVDRVIPIPGHIKFDETLLEEDDEKAHFLRGLREEKFDLLIQLHGGGRYSNAFINSIGPVLSVGASTVDAPRLDINVPYTRFQHEVLRQLEIVEKVGGKPHGIHPRLSVNEEERKRAGEFLRTLLPHGERRKTVLINPGATDPRRRWPYLKFAEVCEALLKQGHNILLNVSPEERPLGEQILKSLGQDKNAFIISPSLDELAGVVAHSDLVISNDTGTSHLAWALDIPTVTLFWFVNLISYGPMNTMKNRVLVSHQCQCPVCDENYFNMICDHEHSFVSSIPSHDVLKASEELMRE
ncbi:MAG: glycosyltransferase family 9 protein [Bacteriovoracia bacterium]